MTRKTLNGAWEIGTFKGHTEWVSSISLSLDGRYVLSGSFDKTVKLWEIATGECVKTFEGHTDYVVAVDLSADAKYALSSLQSRAHTHGSVRRSDGQIPAMMEIRFLGLANREVDDAVQWYESNFRSCQRLTRTSADSETGERWFAIA